MFSESEKRFLMQERAELGMKQMIDLRTIGCPSWLFERVLERRAAQLGPEALEKFRAEQAAAKPKRTQSLEQKITASKLW